MRSLDKKEKDMFLMGLLLSCTYTPDQALRGKRRRAAYRYSFEGEEVCVGAFRHVYEISHKVFKNISKHISENGPVPREHGNLRRRPVNAFTFLEVKFCVDFVKTYADLHGLPYPAPTHGRAAKPPVYLPASESYKSMHKTYISVSQEQSVRHTGKSTFISIWKACLPHIKFMDPRADVCSVCENCRAAVAAAVAEADKLAAIEKFSKHIAEAQRERELYRSATLDAAAALQNRPPHAPPYEPCSSDIAAVHYTFDFAQQVTLPHMARQPGPLYFKTPRKVQLF